MHPLQTLPLALFGLAWKTVWVFALWRRLWYERETTAAVDSTFFEIALGVAMAPIVAPWTYVYPHYFKAPPKRWKQATAHRTAARAT